MPEDTGNYEGWGPQRPVGHSRIYNTEQRIIWGKDRAAVKNVVGGTRHCMYQVNETRINDSTVDADL